MDPSHSGTVLFITDQSLRMLPTPYIKCHVTCKSKSIPVMTDCGNHVFHLKDAFIDQGRLHSYLSSRKPAYEVSDQVRHIPICTVTEEGHKLEILDIRRKRIVLFMK